MRYIFSVALEIYCLDYHRELSFVQFSAIFSRVASQGVAGSLNGKNRRQRTPFRSRSFLKSLLALHRGTISLTILVAGKKLSHLTVLFSEKYSKCHANMQESLGILAGPLFACLLLRVLGLVRQKTFLVNVLGMNHCPVPEFQPGFDPGLNSHAPSAEGYVLSVISESFSSL